MFVNENEKKNWEVRGLTLTTLKYFFMNQLKRTIFFFKFDININVLVSSFRFIWIPGTYVWSTPLYIFYSFSAEIDFRRQNLTSKVYPHTGGNRLLTSESDVYSLSPH